MWPLYSLAETSRSTRRNDKQRRCATRHVVQQMCCLLVGCDKLRTAACSSRQICHVCGHCARCRSSICKLKFQYTAISSRPRNALYPARVRAPLPAQIRIKIVSCAHSVQKKKKNQSVKAEPALASACGPRRDRTGPVTHGCTAQVSSIRIVCNNNASLRNVRNCTAVGLTGLRQRGSIAAMRVPLKLSA